MCDRIVLGVVVVVLVTVVAMIALEVYHGIAEGDLGIASEGAAVGEGR